MKIRVVTAKELHEQQKRKSDLHNELTDIRERLSRMENILVKILEKVENIEEKIQSEESEKNRGKSERRIVIRGREEKKRSAIEIMKEQGILFESDLKNINNKDKFFSYLSRHGIIVIEGLKERVAVTKEFLDGFMKELEKFRNPGEAEEGLKGSYKRLYELLRQSGYLIYDTKKGWVLVIEK